MDINLQNPAPSTAQIKQTSTSLCNEIKTSKTLLRSRLKTGLTLSALLMLLSALISYFVWPASSLSELIDKQPGHVTTFGFALFGLGLSMLRIIMLADKLMSTHPGIIDENLSYALRFIAFFVILTFLIVSIAGFSFVYYAFFASDDFIATAVGVAGFAVVIAAFQPAEKKHNKAIEKIIDLEILLKSYQFTDKKSCLTIAKMLKNETIRAYRNSVLSEDRRFIKAEMEAMKILFGSADEIAAIEAACREVYPLEASLVCA